MRVEQRPPDQHHQESSWNIRLAARHANLIVAGATIDRSIVFRQERNLRLDSTLGANHRMHFARSTISASTRSPLGATTRTTTGTTAGLIHQPFLLVKLLFAGGKNEVISTLTAFQGFVNETQTRDLLVICWYSSGSISLQSHQLCVTPSSAGLNVLDEHCIPDRDRIPLESIHYPLAIIKSFSRNLPGPLIFLMKFLYTLPPAPTLASPVSSIIRKVLLLHGWCDYAWKSSSARLFNHNHIRP